MSASSNIEPKPCKRGHTSGREGNSYCVECRRENARRRYRSNPLVAQKVKDGATKWRKANPDKIAAKGRSYKKRKPVQVLLWSARNRARKGGFPCTITAADIVIPEFCPLLGIRLERGEGPGGAGPASPSLDKIRPELGYVPGNVWVISYRANMIKNDATLQELQTLVERLACVLS